jgi:hypothetical protein
MKKTFGLLVVLIVLLFLILAASYVELSYSVRGRGVVMPLEEWGLYRGSGGSLVHIHENHLDGVVSEYGVSEIQRGDVARYVFDELLIKGGNINRGDTLARLITSDIQLKIIELEGDLSYQKSLLSSYLAGEKPEEIEVAENRIELARQELDNQKLLTNRVVILFEEDVVSRQEYELSLNDLKVKERALEIALSQYNALMAGRKQEDLQVIRSRVTSLESQIQQMKKHIDAFHLVSPVSGEVIRERNPLLENVEEVILRVADFSSYVVLIPVDYSEIAYLKEGQTVSIKSGSEGVVITGELAAIDKTIRLISNRPKIFLTVLVNNDEEIAFFRNMMVDVQVDCGKISFWEYLNRLTKAVYHN